MKWLGQGEEDRLIFDYFDRTGWPMDRAGCPGGPERFFLDVGANDGVSNSNTRRLAERGWYGVCVEPEPRAFAILSALYRDTPEVACLPVLAGPRSGLARFWVADDASVSTTDLRHKERWERQAGVSYRCTLAPEIAVDEILAHAQAFRDYEPGSISVVSIDTEGTSDALACLIDFRAVGTRVAIVEHGFEPERLDAHMLACGLVLLEKNSNNTVWVRP